jgi:hypothetical protein
VIGEATEAVFGFAGGGPAQFINSKIRSEMVAGFMRPATTYAFTLRQRPFLAKLMEIRLRLFWQD